MFQHRLFSQHSPHLAKSEIKCAEAVNKAHLKQLQTYLRLTRQPVGLLINFAGATLKEGLRRVVNDYVPSASSRLRVNQIQNGATDV